MDVLLILFDAGEALAFQPILPHLDEAKVDYRIMAMGTAREFLREHPRYLGLRRDLGSKVDIGRMNWRHHDHLPTEEVQGIQEKVQAQLVIVGMVSAVQRQLANAFRGSGAKVVGYFDALHRIKADGAEASFLPVVDAVWVPSDRVAHSIAQVAPDVPCFVVGQPSVHAWIEHGSNSAIEAWLDTLPTKSRRVVYASGYGEDFRASFETFVKASLSIPDLQVVVSLHPRVPGDIEAQVLRKYASPDIHVVPREFSTVQIAHYSDVMVCYRSTAGFQALFLERPVIYVLSGTVPFTNLPIELGLVEKVCSVVGVEEALTRALDNGKGLSVPEVKEAFGLPEDSVGTLLNSILQCLS